MTTAFDSFDPDNIRLEDVQEFTKRNGTRAPMRFAKTITENRKLREQHKRTFARVGNKPSRTPREQDSYEEATAWLSVERDETNHTVRDTMIMQYFTELFKPTKVARKKVDNTWTIRDIPNSRNQINTKLKEILDAN